MTAAMTSAIKLPRSVVTELSGKIVDESVIASLSPSKPTLFADETHIVFNPSAEGDVVAEGAKKGAYDQAFTPVEGKRIKVVTTTRVSNELIWADEDNKLEIIENILADQAGAIGRALDYVVFHALNPKSGQAASGYTALTTDANKVQKTSDISADLDSMVDALVDYEINGLGLSRSTAAALRKLRYPASGLRMYPEVGVNLKPGSIEGIPTVVSNTVSGAKAQSPTNVMAIMGDFNQIKWGLVRDMTSEVIPYGDPDNTGADLKGSNQVAYRTEAVLSYAVLDPKAFAYLTSAPEAA